jgi:peroxiredoxin family protein
LIPVPCEQVNRQERRCEGGTMEERHIEELRVELAELLRKQNEVLESRMLGCASDSDVLEYEIRQEIVHQLCNQLAHTAAE